MLDGFKTYPGPGQRKKDKPEHDSNHGGSTYFYKVPPLGRELPRPPTIPPPDYMEAMKSRNTFGRPVTRHQSAREPMVSVGIRPVKDFIKERPKGAHLVTPQPLQGDHHDSSQPTVVFNTNEQKTATIGRVPRVSKMSSFYGVQDLNSSIQDRTSTLSKDKSFRSGTKDSLKVPTVYRIGSLHLSEGVNI